MLLRKKKYQENLLITTDKQLENLEKLTSDLEFAAVEQKVLDGLKVGNEELKKIHEILTIDEIERVLDETNEGIEKQREIDDILNQHAASLTDQDEEDILAELEELTKSEETTTADKIEENVNLPEVPTEELPSNEAGEEPVPIKKRKEKTEPVALEA